MKTVALDTGEHRSDFDGIAMVRCPHCNSLAWSSTLAPTANSSFSPRRVTCTACAFTKEWCEKEISRARGEEAIDDYFHLPLFLQVRCAGHILWAYNIEHLQYMQAWLSADLRTRQRDAVNGWSNASFLSRLPRWMKLAKNRSTVVSGLQHLQSLAEKAGR